MNKCTCSESDVSIVHTDGYKDEYMVEVEFGVDAWAPTNEDIFNLIQLWFEAEDYEFGDGYGRWMPMFYVGLIALGYEEKAFEAYGKRGFDAVTHFEKCVEEHGDELIAEIQKLQE